MSKKFYYNQKTGEMMPLDTDWDDDMRAAPIAPISVDNTYKVDGSGWHDREKEIALMIRRSAKAARDYADECARLRAERAEKEKSE